MWFLEIFKMSELLKCASALPEMIADMDALTEALNWEELERTAMPSEGVRAVADYLRSIGQASA